MRIKSKRFMGIAVGLVVVIAVLAIVCIKEYSAIQRNKVDSLNRLFITCRKCVRRNLTGDLKTGMKSLQIYIYIYIFCSRNLQAALKGWEITKKLEI